LKKDQDFKLHSFLFSFVYKKETGVVSVEQLRDIFDLPTKQYTLIGHLKSRLLLPTVERLNKLTNLNIEVKDEKP